ncbi:MAG: glycoside hydrolase domain-containing protein [Muribaculaceae bacterium]
MENNPAVTASNDAVKVTAYKKGDKILLSLGNYSDKTQNVTLNIDSKQLNLNKSKYVLRAIDIPTFQSAMQWQLTDEISIEPRKGWLIYLEPEQ